MSDFISMPKIANRYDLSEDWFRSRIKNQTFKKGVHYFQPEPKGAIRWDVEKMDEYWGIGTIPSADVSPHDELIKSLLK